jgi:hypothetical protein
LFSHKLRQIARSLLNAECTTLDENDSKVTTPS